MQVHQSQFRSIWTMPPLCTMQTDWLRSTCPIRPPSLAISIPLGTIQFIVYWTNISSKSPTHGTSTPHKHTRRCWRDRGCCRRSCHLATKRGEDDFAEARDVNGGRFWGMMDALKVIWTRDGIKGFVRDPALADDHAEFRPLLVVV